jgi:hypothetical protein
MYLLNKIIYFTIILFCFAAAQETPVDSIIPGRTITVIPGAEYQSGWLHNIFFGKHWRELWITPIRVPVLDLKKYAGGLAAIKRGGGFQTKSLHFKGNNGKFYKFRSINKDPKKVLPDEIRNTFVADIVQDQISTSHPLSAVIASHLLTEVGVLNSEPMIFVLPNDTSLGEFRDDFKYVLGTFAVNPKDDTEEDVIFAGADKVVKLYKIFDKLEEDNDNKIDEEEYLKARLMDIYLGDWDRHVGQWKWIRFKDGKRKIWWPVPRDRDQAFARYDGLFPWIAAKAVPQIEGFGYSYPQINDITWSGRHLDRRFLVSLEKTEWDSIANFIYTRLTDQVIEQAVRKTPQEWYDKEGPLLVEMLRSRRDKFLDMSGDFYEQMSRYVSIYTSDKKEMAEIKRIDNERVSVDIYKKEIKPGNLLYSRTFHNDYTDEIRLDLLGGNDTAIVHGEVDNSILVRVIGGEGKDYLADSSRVNGHFLRIQQFRYAKDKTFFYDSGNKTEFISGPSTVIDTEKAPSPKPYEEGDNVNEKYEPPIEDRDYDWKSTSRFNFNTNDGFTLGGGPVLIKHGFRKNPYQYQLSLVGAYVTNLHAFALDFTGNFIIRNNRKIFIEIQKAIGYTNFHGYGNETQRNSDLADKDFYLIRFNLFNTRLNYVFDATPQQNYWFGLSLNTGEVTSDQGSLLDSLQLKNAYKRTYYGLHFGLNLDYRDHSLTPFEGFYIDLQSFNYPRFLNSKRHYHKLLVDLRGYYKSEFITTSSLGLRINIEKLWGEYQLHESAFLGGQKNLRGFIRERFAGDAFVYGGAELRTTLFPIKIVFPSIFGFNAFVESGRVFFEGDTSRKWHLSYGGGLWISFLNRTITLNGTMGKSEEDLQFYFTTGYMF